jgi:hypothetical protein
MDDLGRTDLDRVLAIDRFVIAGMTQEQRRARREVWLRDLIYGDFALPAVADGDVVFFRSLVRDDYRQSFHAVIDASGVENPVVIEDYQARSRPARLNPETSRFLLENHGLFDAIVEPDGLVRALLFQRLALYQYIRSHFGAVRPRAVVFFADMQPVEYLLARHFRSLGVPTVTLQHGLYVEYGDYDTINRINYLHQPSDYFLSWGPDTSALIARHQPDTRIVECGKPVIFSADPPDGAAPAPRPYIALLLDQKPFHAQNEAMIEIARAHALKANMDVVARFHPSLPKAEILKKYPGLREQLHFSDAALVIGHTTSMIYEALALGCRVMRYASDIPAIALPETAEFTTLAELEAGLALPQPEGLWRRYFTAIGDPALKRYRAFFDDLLAAQPAPAAAATW